MFISTCVPWESNPQPFALLTQCSTTEPHTNTSSTFLTPKDQTVKDNVQKVPKNKTSTSAEKIKFIFLRKCYLFKCIYLNFQLIYFMNV